jgi:endoglucanase
VWATPNANAIADGPAAHVDVDAATAANAHSGTHGTARADADPAPLWLGATARGRQQARRRGRREVRLTGVNWSGLETNGFAPIGLRTRKIDDMLDQIAAAGFNTIRLPYSNQLLEPTTRPKAVNFSLNPQLQGLNGLGLLDYVVDGAGRRGLRVILDRHRPTADGQVELWYTEGVPEARWIQDWVMLATRYKGNPTVIGADLSNEPHGAATWGDDNPATDWRLAAERAGNAILETNPDWLIVVEGVEHAGGETYWWGGNLSGAAQVPVRLSRPDRLVYSAHDYGPEESWQSWFGSGFPDNLPGIWGSRWAYLQQNGIAPVLVGEFGGRSIGGDTEGVWQRALVRFLEQGGYSYTYWVWNPDSWVGGLLVDDQGRLDRAKLALLGSSQAPPLAKPQQDNTAMQPCSREALCPP